MHCSVFLKTEIQNVKTIYTTFLQCYSLDLYSLNLATRSCCDVKFHKVFRMLDFAKGGGGGDPSKNFSFNVFNISKYSLGVIFQGHFV